MQYLTKCSNNLLKHSAIVALCFIFSLSCNQKSTEEAPLPLITDYIVDSVYLPITEADDQVHRIKEVAQGKYAPQELIAFIRRRNYKLYYFSIDKGAFLDSMSLFEYQHEYADFYPIGKDSVYIEQGNNKITQIFNGKTRVWDISPITNMIGPMVYIGFLSMNSLQAFGDTVICITTTSERKKKEGPNIPFIKANHDIMLRLLSDTIQFIAKYNPNPDHFLKQSYYSTAERVYLNNHEAVYSFAHSDTLILHDFATGKDKWVKLKTKNFFTNPPFDYSKVMDYKYIDEYQMGNSRLGLGTLFYDRTQKRIYQLLNHKGTFIEADGRKNDYSDLPKSLFVFDERLNQLKEILIPGGTFNSIYYSFITHKGLYFAAHPSKQKYNDKMLFYRIVIR
jgi:hypothetical protein